MPAHLAAEAQLNVTNEELKQRINDSVNPQLNSCGGIRWTRVAYLDMRDPGSVRPTNWTSHTSPVRGCGRFLRSLTLWCFYHTNSLVYLNVYSKKLIQI